VAGRDKAAGHAGSHATQSEKGDFGHATIPRKIRFSEYCRCLTTKSPASGA